MTKKQKVILLAILLLVLVVIPIIGIVDHKNDVHTYMIMCVDHGGTPVYNGSHYECFQK